MAITISGAFGDLRPLLLGAMVRKPKMTVKIASGSDVCLSSCSSIMEYTRIVGFVPSEMQKALIIVIRICEDDTPTLFGTMGL